jgi:DNA-binding NtrC family response regulator
MTMLKLAATPEAGHSLKVLLRDYERYLIRSALAASGGHQRRAAAALGVLPSTLCEKMRRLGLRQQPRRPELVPESEDGPRHATNLPDASS